MKSIKYYVFFILGILIISKLTAGEFQVNKSKDNLVKFISDAPVEDFGE